MVTYWVVVILMIPKHVAIIMDGNGRWAKKRAMPRTAGHVYGVKAVKKAVQFAAKNKIDVLTLFALSTENLSLRPATEVGHLLSLLVGQLETETQELHENQVKISFIGDHSQFSTRVKTLMEEACMLTKHNTGLHLVIALNYSGQWDITQAARGIAAKVASGLLTLDEVGIEEMGRCICLHDLPAPDLLIRTSGELRISNFLLWQLAYSELFFTDVLWPDFDDIEFGRALEVYANRSRKFGKTLEQVEQRDA